jgi:hypothetical protein
MSEKRQNWLPLRVLAYAILAGGLVGTAAEFFTRPEMAIPQDLGRVLGNGALVLLGLVTSMIASVLKNLEMRLDKIERQSDSGQARVNQE